MIGGKIYMRFYIKTILIFFIFLFAVINITSVSAQEWWDGDWSNRKEIDIENVGGSSLLNYTAYIKVIKTDSMQSDFISLIDGLYSVLPNDKPHNMMVAMQAIPLFFLEMLITVYKIDITSKDFYAECKKHFNEETIEDIGAVIFSMGELEKRTKKFKRINAKMQEMVKEAITLFILAVMSIHTDEMDGS